MRSRTYFSERLRLVGKGGLWLPAFLFLGFLLAFPVAGLIQMGNWSSIRYTPEQTAMLYENLWRDGFLWTGAVVAAGAAFLNAVHGFLYLYSAKQTDFYHSLPLKRSRMFWGRVGSGLIVYLIPYVVMEFLMICVGAARGFFGLKLMGMAGKLLVLHLILYLMLYFSIVLILCLTGNLLMGILCLAGINLYAPVLSFLLINYGISFFPTFWSEKPYGALAVLWNEASPVLLVTSFCNAYAHGSGEWQRLLGVIIPLAWIFGNLSYLAYVKRPSEAAGKSVVYRGVAAALRFLVVVPCGLGLGYVFFIIPGSGMRGIWWIFGMILGTVLSHGMIETIYQMDFRAFFSKKLQLLAAGVLVAVCALIYYQDLLGFNTYLPRQKEIVSVNADLYGYSGIYGSSVSQNEDGTYNVNYMTRWHEIGREFQGEKGIGDKTYAVLESIVREQEKRPNMMRVRHSTYAEIKDEDSWSYAMGFSYRLKSGRMVYRSYEITSEDVGNLILALYEEENLKDYQFGFQKVEQKYIDNVSLSTILGDGYSVFPNEKEKLEKLLDALNKDIENLTAEDLVDTPAASLSLNYSLPVKAEADNLVPGQKNVMAHASWVVNVMPAFKETLAILKETGYPLSIDEVNIRSVTVTYYGDEGETSVEYTKPKEIEALKAAMYPGDFYAPWLKRSAGVSAVYTSDQGGNRYVDFLADKLPDFVKEKMAEVGSDKAEE